MAGKSFPQYKYPIPKEYFTYKAGFPLAKLIVFFVTLPLIFISGFTVPPVAIFLIIGLIMFLLSGIKRQIMIADRYFIMGTKVFYYNNIKTVTIDNSTNTCSIELTRKKPVIIYGKMFPTGARKSWKIEKNKKEKFQKVTAKLTARIKDTAPHVSVITQPGNA